MGTTKTEKFTKEQNEIARLLKAMAHPARIAILEVLIGKNSCVCGEIVEEIPLSQSTISQHLKELKDVGLIQGELKPPKIKYCINKENWNKAKLLFQDFFDK